MYSRPTSEETQEDLIRLQEEFERQRSYNKIKLAATVVSEQKDPQPQTFEVDTAADIRDQLANTFEAIPEKRKLGNIIEKNRENCNITAVNFSTNQGFPRPKRRDVSHDDCKGSGSIFSQHFKRAKRVDNTPVPVEVSTKPSTKSSVLTDSEKKAIHEENIQKMESISEEEILEEREKLLATMDPALIAFLKSRRENESVPMRNPTIKEQNKAAENIEIEEIEAASEILNQPQAEKWLNFKTVEVAKLEWMKNVEMPEKNGKRWNFEARFDFEGWVLPYMEEEITEKNRILYHHGEEPGRPGYTLQELFQLARSNVVQQKIIALNTIANLLSLESTGLYDNIIDLPIEQIFFVLRICLDDNTPAVLNASIKATRNLFYSKIDETCLDCLLGFGLGQIEPTLAVDEDLEDDNRINDQQLAETNLVKCLLRTDILTRMIYIINTVRPGIETIMHVLDLLIRLVRDSQYVLTKVYNCEDLMHSIIKNFVPNIVTCPLDPYSPHGLPLGQALKLLRILATRSRDIANELVDKYRVVDSIMIYLSNDSYSMNTNGLKLQIESLRLWAVFIRYGLAMDHIAILQPLLIEMLNYHFKNTNLEVSTTYVRQSHVSALLVLIESCCKSMSLVTPFFALLRNCVVKWLKQLMALRQFTCGKLQVVSAIFCLLSSLSKSTDTPRDIYELILEVVNSHALRTITKTIKNGSMLLNDYETHRTTPNIKHLEAAAWYASEHVVPLIQTNSPMPFLSSLSNFIERSDNVDLKLAFLRHEHLRSYLEALRSLGKYHLTGNWFTRIEANLVMNILKIAVSVKADLDTRPFYEVAVKCLSIFMADYKPDIEYVVRNIIFSKDFYPSEVLMRNLSIDEGRGCFEMSLDNLDDILKVYVQVLGLRVGVPLFSSNQCLDHGKGNVIPVDWIYTPIIVLYSSQQQNKKNSNENEQTFIIRNCLRWILIYETYFPELSIAINPADRYCRIACVFLGSDSLFLSEEIHTLLQLCLNNIAKSENEINFNKEIEGLTSFQEFYTQLLEQYQAVSYGDTLFANFILLPLAQRHSVKWRKMLWSEYLGVVQMFNLTVEQSVCSLELFLNPKEEDLSLLKCYRKALVNGSVRKHSVLYSIAKYHVETYVASKRNKQ